ncbi:MULTISPECIES: hypothetical protein [Asticcacaulis]|uniref:hypothetical protein n=1 Tax=Asticcacaulis TaxID=76890 RepID=UPI001AE7EE0C|nr:MULTISPECIES: hypothetical protein [Asticcacaulis]MBP2159230.1 hypothetical protein [Asticcacaulis solisilvae]MDR6800275.1 hypothetical protein [Asticcacaulis sp. BE141]
MAFPNPRPIPGHKPDYTHQVRYDGEFYEEELPPELFDPQEDDEELAVFHHIADHIDD